MGADPANNVDPTGGFIPGGIPCPGTSGFGLFMQGVGNALSKALPTLTTVATIGAPALNALRLGNTISQHQRNLNLSLNLFGQKQQADEDEIKKNISIVIPLEYSSREKLYWDKDGQDEGDWHYIVARDVNEARDKLKRYLGKTKADNIILDTHAGIDNRTFQGVVFNDQGDQIAPGSFSIYPRNSNEDVKKGISSILNIGKSVKDGGNFLISSCYAGKDKDGTEFGKNISGRLGSRTLYLNEGYTKPTLNSFNVGGKGWKVYPRFGSMQDTPGAKFKSFNNGAFRGSGNININKSGAVFQFTK
jgi:hypothetical protein